MRTVIVMTGAALALSVGRADGQVYRGQWYDPYAGRAISYGTGFNPWTGSYYRDRLYRNPWTGTYGVGTVGHNPWTGWYWYRR
jgi:hypothetical protein